MENVKKITKSTYLNIDSAYRNMYPKNICNADGRILPTNPLTMTTGSSIITVNFPNHNLSQGDNIVMQNVVGYSKILSNYFFLINNFAYCMILYYDNKITSNYKNYVNSLYVDIELVGGQTESNIINNIPFNNIMGFKQSYIVSDIPSKDYNGAKDYIKKILSNVLSLTFNNDTELYNYILANCLFISLPTNYINTSSDYYNVNQVFKVAYQHIGGIMLGYLQANFPISNIYYQSNFQIYNVVDTNNFQISLNYKSYGNLTGGGKNVQVMKIINTMTGYPDANNYVISLKKSFNNVTKIELVSMEIPYIDIVIQTNVNDKLFWKHIEDGDTMYYVRIDEGFYSNTTLLTKLQTAINMVPRITSSLNNSIATVYNNFDITLETNIQKITFKPYNMTPLPNSLSITLQILNSVPYYILTIVHPTNFINVGDNITITNAMATTYESNGEYFAIDSEYINKTFSVYSINIGTQSYSVVLGTQDSITETLSSTILNGGTNVIVRSDTKVSFFFNRNDTMGNVLGFKNVGDVYSIIDFSPKITNKDAYINSFNLNSVGNIINYSSGFINLSGQYNYIVMYLNDIEYIYFNNNLTAAFAKVLLNGNPGDILFNTYVGNSENLYSKNFPIASLTDITVQFTYPDGSMVNFRNINHSFTLKITEEHNENDTINIDSQKVSMIDEYKKVYKPA